MACSCHMPGKGLLLCRTRDLVGKLALHDDVSTLLLRNMLPYTIVEDPDRKTVGIKTQMGDTVSAEALVVRSCHNSLPTAACPERWLNLVPVSLIDSQHA